MTVQVFTSTNSSPVYLSLMSIPPLDSGTCECLYMSIMSCNTSSTHSPYVTHTTTHNTQRIQVALTSISSASSKSSHPLQRHQNYKNIRLQSTRTQTKGASHSPFQRPHVHLHRHIVVFCSTSTPIFSFLPLVLFVSTDLTIRMRDRPISDIHVSTTV
jgi:hypothetical protein